MARVVRVGNMKYIPLFILIQLVSLVLTLLGLPIVLICLFHYHHYAEWPKWAWLWFNDEDGFGPKRGFWNEFNWLAIRNSCNNLRYVRGVSKPGRPLWYWTNGKHYAKAGWEAGTGWPSLSAGSGNGF